MGSGRKTGMCVFYIEEIRSGGGWNDEVKDTVRRNKAAWKEGLAASNEEAK